MGMRLQMFFENMGQSVPVFVLLLRSSPQLESKSYNQPFSKSYFKRFKHGFENRSKSFKNDFNIFLDGSSVDQKTVPERPGEPSL